MKVFISIFLAGLSYTGIICQPSDQQAATLLEELSNKYESYRSFKLDFEMKIESNDRPAEIQKGQLIQKGNKYKLDTPDQMITSDGNLIWVYLKNQNEVQIDNADMDEENISSFSPKQVLKHFNSGSYDYALTPSSSGKENKTASIEFKPLDKDSEYSKMRLSIQKNRKEITEIFLLSNDGSRYTISIKEMVPNKEYSDQVFTFDPAQYPGIYIEDLRIE